MVVGATLADPFPDFELVVVDNDDTDSTGQALADYSDPRLRIIRSGGLNMVQNWDLGYRSALGEILIYIEDKIYLRPGAAQKIVEFFTRSPHPILTYQYRYVESPGDTDQPLEEDLRVFSVYSQSLFDFLSICYFLEYERFAPRAINTAVRKSFADRACAGLTSPFTAVAPDFTSGARYLLHADKFSHCEQPLACRIASGPSIGRSAFHRGPESEQFFRELGGTWESFMVNTPLQVALLSNLLLNDILGVWGDRAPKIDSRDYYLMLGTDISMGGGTPVEHREVRSALQSEGSLFLCSLIVRTWQRLLRGWPNRRLRVRENLPQALKILGALMAKD